MVGFRYVQSDVKLTKIIKLIINNHSSLIAIGQTLLQVLYKYESVQWSTL